jgi:hypothetical protein
LVVRDHAGSGTVEVIDADGLVLATASDDAWRGAGQWHWIEFAMDDGQLVEVLLDDMRVIEGVELPAGQSGDWLRVLGRVGPGGVADIRLKPTQDDAVVSGESLLRGALTTRGDLGAGLGSEGLSLRGSGWVHLGGIRGRTWRLRAKVRFGAGSSASLEVDGVSIAIAEGRSPAPSTGSILGHRPLAVRLIPDGTWYDLEVSRGERGVSVAINGIVVATANPPSGQEGVAISLQEGAVDIGSLFLDSFDE